MANKAFEIQNSTLRIGGVEIEAGSTTIIIPGITQATNYFVEEVDDIDGDNPDIFGSNTDITIIDNAEFLYRSGTETASGSYSAAEYIVDELDDGEIDGINVEVAGVFSDSDKALALDESMWATTVADPYTNFDANDWTQIPFKPKMRAGAVTNAGVPYIELTNAPLIVLPSVLNDQPVSFTRLPNISNTDFIDTGLTLARGSIRGLFNAESEGSYDNNLHTSPAGTKWNADGWGDLSSITSRSYGTLRSVLNNAIGENILNAELIMHDTINDKYYKFDFTDWGENNGGSFAYTRTLIENQNFFKKVDYATGNTAIDVFVADDGNGSGVAITRGNNSGIYNPFREDGWDSDVSPVGTLWNIDGWDDFSDIETRTYTDFNNAYNGNLGNNVPGTKSVMYIPDTDEYYAIHWLSWTPNNAGGGFSYLRYEIDKTQINEGITFADGSVLKSAEGVGRVKLRSPGNRRIEEVYGYNEVGVTAVSTFNLTTLASRNGASENRFWIDSSNTTIDDVLNNTQAAEILDATSIQFSLDNSTWYTFSGSTWTENNEKGYGVTIPDGQLLNYDAGDTIYFRYDAGGVPVTWWDKADLPEGGSNFRGAVIDYHAYTGDSTIIGTIHIVDDDGEEHISHIETQSGSDNGENDDLWYVTTEGQIQYRRIDGASKILKVQWSAKVFYGSEYWD